MVVGRGVEVCMVMLAGGCECMFHRGKGSCWWWSCRHHSLVSKTAIKMDRLLLLLLLLV